MPVVGLYAGSHVPVAIPGLGEQEQEEHNATALLVFKAFGVDNVTVSAGSAAQRALHVEFLSPGNTTLTLSGPFWSLAQGEIIRLTIRTEDGQVARTETLPASVKWTGMNWRTRPTYVFEKVGAL